MQYCRGPLPAGHPAVGVTYFSPDADVAAQACNLRVTPPVETLRCIDGPCVLLDAHRAPDEWFAIACMIPQLLVQGDPLAPRPRGSTLFAKELEKQESCDQALLPHIACVEKLAQAMPHAKGKSIVLAANYSMACSIYNKLRPNGFENGDLVQDFYGRSYRVSDASSSSTHVFIDEGRCAKKRSSLTQHLAVSPSMVRAGEYDTVIVMPGVSPTLGKAVCHRCRYKVIAVAHSPYGYLRAKSQQSSSPA